MLTFCITLNIVKLPADGFLHRSQKIVHDTWYLIPDSLSWVNIVSGFLGFANLTNKILFFAKNHKKYILHYRLLFYLPKEFCKNI